MSLWITNDILSLSDEIGKMAEEVKGELHALRPMTTDRAPLMNGVVNAELKLMSIKMELRKLNGYINAAVTTGAIPRPHAEPRYPDHQCAAAHDLTLTEEPLESRF